MTRDEWNDINTLLAFLRGGSRTAADCVDDYYLKLFGNPAPGSLLREQIDVVQLILDSYQPHI